METNCINTANSSNPFQVHTNVTRVDLEAIDTFSYKLFDQVMNAENQEGINEETFEEIFDLFFTTISTAGIEVELIPGGKSTKVM